ncbi:MAG: DnaJ domain-containing protein [Actinobacteria bacterium]|nr:DnaJ domain-containing protein [Actinomycetota bacterium]
MAQRDWMDKDFYKILGVDKEAPKDSIKRAYRKLAQKYHPDANKGDKGAEQRFKEISEAHSVLSNDDKRREYDQMRAFVDAGGQRFYGFDPRGPGGGRGNVRINVEDLQDLFGGDAGGGSVFEDLFGFRSRGRQRQGRDIETEVTLDFEDAINGATVTLPDNSTKVRIPAGIGDGARIRVAGKGEAAPADGVAGDLFVRVHVRPHNVFELGKDGDLVIHLPLTIAEAALGAKIQVPTLDSPVTVKVPAGTNSGKTLRVRGKGVPRQSGGTGDLLVKVDVEVPKKLSRREKQLLEEFQEAHQDSPRKNLEAYLTKSASQRAS